MNSKILGLSILSIPFTLTTMQSSGQVINEDRVLIPAGTGSGAFFGRSSAMDNGIVIAGADGAERAFTFNASTGAQIAALIPNDPPSRSFGFSVDIKGNIAVVGARWDGDNGAQAGAAYIFDAFTGAQLHKIVPTDGAPNYYFGYSIALDGGIIAIGARWDGENGLRSGAVYLYNASSGAFITKILAPDGAASDAFGHSVAMQNGIIAIGSPEDDDVTVNSGSVYLFNTAGTLIRKIIADDPGLADQFGYSVAIDDGVLAVGSNQDNIGNNDNGSAYLFDIATGNQLFKLTASDTAREDQFGWSIGIDDGVVVVGSHQDDDLGSLSGSAYLFDASSGTQIAKMLPSDGGASEYFGSSVAIDNGIAVGGSILFGPGSVHVFSVPTPPCPADLTGDGSLNFLDVSAYLTAFGNMDPIADFEADGNFNFLDVSAFLAAFGAGCP
ncbi:MAG: FG-GAP repeat protein, partial [Phycisphaerales bacterium]|nr:FG-GAP repeat protein [Phycisphaerales bacterium]